MIEQLELFAPKNSTQPIHDGPLHKINGLTYVPTYVSIDEQQTMLESIDALPWLDDLRRRVQHFGFRYDYKSRRVDPSMRLGILPSWADAIAHRLHRDGYFEELPDQAIINEYQPGQGITPHIDCEPCFGPSIASVSLGSPAAMSFTQCVTGERVDLLLEVGSLVVLQGEARYEWKHSIPARMTDRVGGKIVRRRRRVSATFRTVILN